MVKKKSMTHFWQGFSPIGRMQSFDLPEDQATLKAVERRRSAESARKARIYDTRLRVMGLDVDALNQQVEEKRRRQNMEILRDETFGKIGITSDGGVRVTCKSLK